MNPAVYYPPAHLILHNLFLGSCDAGWNHNFLLQNKIMAVLQVCPYYDYDFCDAPYVERQVISENDVPTTNLYAYFPQTSKWIHRQLQMNHKTLVHCMAGVSRSTTIVVAYLMALYHWTRDYALQYVSSIRGIVQPNEGFMYQLLLWQNYLQSNSFQF